MPVSRRPVAPSPAASPSAPAGRGRLPRRIVAFAIVTDESGSMRHWRQRQGTFIPQVTAHLMEAGGPRVGGLIYIMHAVVSGGVAMTDFSPLAGATEPQFTPDGQTPIGTALSAVAEKCREFLEARVFPEEVTVRDFEVLIVSDFKATGETGEETKAGVEKFLDMARKYRAKVNLVGPSPEEMDADLPKLLDVSGRGIRYLDADPKSIVNITFDSLLSASRTLGGSNPDIRNR